MERWTHPSRRQRAPNTCSVCGSYVSGQFVRVFGNNNDEVFGCLHCVTTRDLRLGRQLVEPQY